MISVGSLVRTKAHRWGMPLGAIYMVISDPYKPANTQPDYTVVDILFKGEPRVIDIHSVEEIK